jgi:DNA processing protein
LAPLVYIPAIFLFDTMGMTETDGNTKRWAWLALHLIPGLGNIVFRNLVEHFGNAEQILEAKFADLKAVVGVRDEIARRILRREFTVDPDQVFTEMDRLRARILVYNDPPYPHLLKEIYDPPMVLYVRGRELPPDMALVALVGSRNPTPYGRRIAEELGQGLAKRSMGVASGLARGIDAASHWGCLSGKGWTVAVLGTGIDRIYPRSNAKLFQRIIRDGTIMSEFPPGTPPEPQNFPIRNRVISGLCKGVIVVEATKKSGSLITAALALDQGRDVFAVPGNISSFKSKGCHFLIKQGAHLVENTDDILEGLGLPGTQDQLALTDFKGQKSPSLSGNEEAIYEMIGDDPLHIDLIARTRNLSPAEASTILMQMELKGLIKQLPGKLFVR